MSVVKRNGQPVYNRKKRNPFKKRVRIYGKAGLQLYKDVRYLKGLINSEPKYLIVQSANNFNWNGIVIPLSNIPQGDGVNNRDGNSVLPRYLNINIVFGITNASTTPGVIKMMVFKYWGESTNVAGSVTPTEILSDVGTQFSPICHLNDDNIGSRGDRQRRIEVLNSQVVSFDTARERENVQSQNFIMNQNNNVKEHIKWNSATTAEPVSGGLYILFVGNTNGVDPSANFRYALESKLTYYDN